MNKHFQVFRNVIIVPEDATDPQELVLLYISKERKGRGSLFVQVHFYFNLNDSAVEFVSFQHVIFSMVTNLYATLSK